MLLKNQILVDSVIHFHRMQYNSNLETKKPVGSRTKIVFLRDYHKKIIQTVHDEKRKQFFEIINAVELHILHTML